MIRYLGMICAAFALLIAPAGRATAQPATDDYGVLVMAHGGGAAWNSEVEAMLAPLARDYRLELAFGMADPNSIQDAVRRLETRGARRIGVVRLFISGESWKERTEQILGMWPGAGPRPAADPHAAHGAGHGGHDMSLWRIETSSRFALSHEGLANAREMGAVLVDRVTPISRTPRDETVLILAHGPEDDAENARWISEINARAEALRTHAPFRAVHVESLREDWPDKRAASEARIHAIAAEAARNNGRLLVLPYRVTGFGPYARVLEGVAYEADRRGLLPSPEVERWVRRQADALRTELTN